MEAMKPLDHRRAKRLTPEQRRMKDQLLREEVARRRWYHCMDLGAGIVTPGYATFGPIWSIIRECRARVDYAGKTVLDLGSGTACGRSRPSALTPR